MKALLPFFRLWRRQFWLLSLGVVLALLTLLASIGLLTLSGWFLAASSLAGAAGLTTFNYMLPAAGVRGAAIVRTASRYFERLVSHDATFRVLRFLRVHTFSALLPLAPAGLMRFRQGELLNRFVADVDTLDHLYLRLISPLISAVIVTLVVALGLGYLDLKLGLLVGSIMLLTLCLLPLLFYRLGQPGGHAISVLRGVWRDRLTGWLQAQAELQIFGMAALWRQRLDETEEQWQQAQRRQTTLAACSQALLTIITGACVVSVLWLAAAGVGDHAQPGALLALVVFCTLAAFEALGPLATAFLHLSQVTRAAERITDIIEQPPAVRFPETSSVLTAASIDLQAVTFSYPGSAQPAVDAVDLHLRAGEKVALLGYTGCGKSTLLNLLTRAWDPQQGTILLSGIPLQNWSEAALRATLTVVTQRVHLFNQTLRENLQVACASASDDSMIDALRQTGLEKLLLDPHGLDAWLGEGGRDLSGGERRRLGIARALLHNGPIWLLDEPTEGLDAETEKQILALLQRLSRDKTVIMVTHRLQGLQHMDRICLMAEGRIVEQGSHLELLSKASHYRAFHQPFTL